MARKKVVEKYPLPPLVTNEEIDEVLSRIHRRDVSTMIKGLLLENKMEDPDT